MPDFSNLILLRLAALELLRAVDPNLAHYCLLVSCASPCKDTSRAARRRVRHATPHAALTDGSPKGRFCFVPAPFLAMNGRQWMQNWHPGMHVNDSNGQSGPALNGIEYINPNGVALARRGVRNVTRYHD